MDEVYRVVGGLVAPLILCNDYGLGLEPHTFHLPCPNLSLRSRAALQVEQEQSHSRKQHILQGCSSVPL